MIVIIVAGGSGTRLWPLSTPEFPKHLLTIVGDKSLLQNTFERAKKVTSVDKIYISTEAGHSDHVLEQLPDVPRENVIIEPARRDTMPCILNALQLISTKHPHDEPIASIHADHHIRDVQGFAQALKVAGEVSSEQKRITLLGLEPSQPDSKYGHIHKGGVIDHEDFVYEIQGFKEKPEYALAKEYFESGEYLWNMGYFVAPYTVFDEAIRAHSDLHWSEQLDRLAQSKSQEERDAIYLGFEKLAIDYGLMEKVPSLLVMPGTFDWMDVGSFDDVYKISSQNQQGNATVGQDIQLVDVEDSYVRNVGDKPVAVIGLDNVTVVNTGHGVLVMRTVHSQKVKQVVSGLENKN